MKLSELILDLIELLGIAAFVASFLTFALYLGG
jgi:hypothetical protein